MDKAIKKGKQIEENQPLLDFSLQRSSIDQQPSPFTEPKLIQEAKRLKHTIDFRNTVQDSPFQDDHHSRFPISSNGISPIPRSGKPPRPPSSPAELPQLQFTIEPLTTATSGLISSAQLLAKRDLNPAQIILHVPEERARANFKLARQKAKRGRVDLVGPLMLSRIRPGLSPLGPDHLTPNDTVKHVLSNVKEFLNRFLIMKSFSKKSPPPNSTPINLDPPPIQPLSIATSNSATLSSSDQNQEIEPSALPLETSSLTVEQVLRMLDAYVETISKTASAQEMEDKLQEFQIRVKVDPLPTWYGLMKKSSLDFFDNLTEYFVCEALESDPEDDDGAEKGSLQRNQILKHDEMKD